MATYLDEEVLDLYAMDGEEDETDDDKVEGDVDPSDDDDDDAE